MKVSTMFLLSQVFVIAACLLSVVAEEDKTKTNLLRTLAASPKIVTLGDSYSAGTGIHRDDNSYDELYGGNPTLDGKSYQLTSSENEACFRETDTTPGPRLAKANGFESIFLACSGARISDATNQFDYLNALYPDDKLSNWAGSTIVLVAGANDALTPDGRRWKSVVQNCVLEFDLFKDCDDFEVNLPDNESFIQTELMTMYKKMASEAGQATIRVLGYPPFMQRGRLGCLFLAGVSAGEADFLDAEIAKLNNLAATAVNDAKVSYPTVDIQFVNVESYFTVGACGLFVIVRCAARHSRRIGNSPLLASILPS